MAAIRPYKSTHDPTIVVVWSKLASGTVYPTTYRWEPMVEEDKTTYMVFMVTWERRPYQWTFQNVRDMNAWLERQYQK